MSKTDTGAIVVKLKKCLSCKACEMACAQVHAGVEDILEAVMDGTPLVPRVKVVGARGRGVPVQCQHCKEAPCVTVCPSGALYKDEAAGETLTAPEKCIGCHACVLVCPFGAVRWSKAADRIVKCDLCKGLREDDEQPACIVACPTHARELVDLDAIISRKQKQAAERAAQAADEEEAVQQE